MRLSRTFPTVDFIGETETSETNALRHQSFLLHPRVFARRADLAARAHDAMPRYTGGASFHGCSNLPRSGTHDTAHVPVRQNPAPRDAADQTVDGLGHGPHREIQGNTNRDS